MVRTAEKKHDMAEVVNLRVDAERMRADFEELTEIGATMSGGILRLALSNADLEARLWFANRLDESGLIVSDDDAGNLSGVLYSALPNVNKTLIIGSHLDSVPNGGRYDSAVGICAAMECLRTLRAANVHLPVHLEVVDFTDQEGAWFSLFGSRCFTGKLPANALKDLHDPAATSAFRAALQRAGIHPDEAYKAARSPETIAGYIELHIEQGSRLWSANKQIGIVTGIIGRSTYDVAFYGEAGHSGTTGLTERRDALFGASDFITRAHHMIRALNNGSVFNCGSIHVEPGAFNVIPRLARATVECRHPDEDTLSQLESQLMELAFSVAQEHRLRLEVKRRTHMPAASMSTEVVDAIRHALRTLEVENSMELVSYAGHDAQMMSSFTPSGMIFIPSVNGISHNPKEYTEWDDVVNGANVLLHTVLQMAYTLA